MNLQQEYEHRCRDQSDIVDHLPRLFDIVCRFPGCRVIELGVRSGNSTAAFLAGAEAVDGHVWSVDVNAPQVPAWWMPTGRWTFVGGSDLDPSVLARLDAECPDGVNVVFIDTSHHHQHTLNELGTYLGWVNPGGFIVCHDTELERPDNSPPDDPPFPVKAAIHAFTERHGFRWVNYPECYGLGVIEV